MFRFPQTLTIAAVGKLKTRHWVAAQDDYLKRLGRYGRVSLVEVKDAVGRGQPDGVAMAKEGEGLLKAAAGSMRLIALTPDGKRPSSPKLAQQMRGWVEDYGRFAFLIGGPLGFAPDVLAASHEQLSLSPLTFTHEMARILLLEQLYRACTILSNEPYHK